MPGIGAYQGSHSERRLGVEDDRRGDERRAFGSLRMSTMRCRGTRSGYSPPRAGPRSAHSA